MDIIIKNQGLHQILFQICDLLDSTSLKNVKLVSKDCHQFINQYFEREIWIRNITELQLFDKQYNHRFNGDLKVFVSHFLQNSNNVEWRKFVKLLGQSKNQIECKNHYHCIDLIEEALKNEDPQMFQLFLGSWNTLNGKMVLKTSMNISF